MEEILHQLIELIPLLFIYKVSTIQGGAGFLPSTVFSIKSELMLSNLNLSLGYHEGLVLCSWWLQTCWQPTGWWSLRVVQAASISCWALYYPPMFVILFCICRAYSQIRRMRSTTMFFLGAHRFQTNPRYHIVVPGLYIYIYIQSDSISHSIPF